MLVDDLNCLLKNYQFSKEIFYGLNYLKNIKQNEQKGYLKLDQGIYRDWQDYTIELGNKNDLFESHIKYIDIQYIVSGYERIDWTMQKDLKVVKDELKEKDVCFYEEPKENFISNICLSAGMAAIFYPQDAHKPKQIIGDSQISVSKIVVKIPVN